MSNGEILGLVAPVIAFIFSVTFFSLWSQQRNCLHLLGFAFAFFMCGLGVTISHFVIPQFSYLNVAVSILLYSIGTGSFFWAHSRRMAQKTPLEIMAGIAFLGTLGALFVTSISLDVSLRFYAVLLTIAGQFMVGAWWIKTQMPCTAENNGLFLTCIVIIMLMTCSPPVVYQIEGPIPLGSFQNSLQWAMTNAYVSVCVIFLSIYLIFGHSKDLLAQIKLAAEQDFLTGLKNRQAYEEGFEQLLAAQADASLSVSVIIADIDNFKRVNDTYGHQTGDNAIVAFGALFRAIAKEQDVAGRVGGEELSLVLWNTNEEVAMLAARQLCAQFAATEIDGLPQGARLTASFGVATSHSASEGKSSLYARADEALYRAKQTGKNRVCLSGAGYDYQHKSAPMPQTAVA